MPAAVSCPPAPAGVTDSGKVFATMASSFKLLGPVEFFAPPDTVDVTDQTDPCSLPGGSDLPGAKLTYELVVDRPSPTRTFVAHYILPDDKAPPMLSGGSTPRSGTPVSAGQTITVHVTAAEPNDKGPQEGIRDIQLTGPNGLVDSKNYGTHPIACDRSRLTETLMTTYTVPKDPPAIITLTAHASDFVNNDAVPLSAEFPTGNTWTGKAHVVTHIRYHGPSHECPAIEVDDDTFTLTVSSSGTVQGKATQVVTITSCGPASHRTDKYDVSGQLTGSHFQFTDLGGIGSSIPTVLVVPLNSSKTTAATQFHGGPVTQSSGGGSSATYTFSGTVSLTR